MVATLLIEFSLALYAIWRYKLTVYTRLVVALLVALGIFQVAEFFVCTGYGFRAEQWSRVGFIAISTLPPLGLHLMHVLAGKKERRLVYASYATLAACVLFFATYHTAFIGHQCTGNYVIFQIGRTASIIYGIYYYAWLAVSITLGLYWLSRLQPSEKTKRQVLQGLIVGYFAFLVPVAITYSVAPSTRGAIPSIMCGFAVLLAIILGFHILPRVGKLRRKK